ncbi:hypothetical protein ACWEOE_26170, partial [Amycolatopsis sp. NPDC004368]
MRAGSAPDRTAAQTGQPQFHCGEPPPAAEPSTRSHIAALRPWSSRGSGSPGNQLLQGLKGKDVLLTFVESYGRFAIEG